MFKIAKASFRQSGAYLYQSRVSSQNFNLIKRAFSDKPPQQDDPKDASNASKYKEAFDDLKAKINAKQEDSKMSARNFADQLKDNLYRNFKLGDQKIDPSKAGEEKTAEKVQAESANKTSTTQEQNVNNQNQNNATDQAMSNADKTTNPTEEKQEAAKQSLKDKISGMSPFLGKVTNYVAEALEETFPSDKYTMKAEQAKKLAKERAEREKEQKVYTEEELEGIQQEIPEWKRTSITQFDAETEEDVSIRSKVTGKLKEKFNQTSAAKVLYQTDQYKEYEDFRKEMSQFREDLKDHMSQSQNVAVIASMAVYNKATSESNTAQAIKEMRKFVKGFDVFDLERDARGIFCDIYDAYLRSDVNYIEATCEDAARAYFKTLIKKREIDGVFPKYTELWTSEPATFVGGRISERNMPCFTYSVQIQEIHCNISKKTNKIVDGSDDRVLQSRYNIVISPHEAPDVELVGHQWVIVEVMPLEAVLMLA